MKSVGMRVLLVVLSVLALGAMAAGLEMPLHRGGLSEPMRPAAGALARRVLAPDSLVRAAVASAPFRASRAAASLSYDPEHGTQVVAPVAPAPPKPVLILAGIVWGADPTAVIEGLPGTDGPRVVRKGEVVGALNIKRIGPTNVIVAGFDTTWNLTLRTPWQ